jgi:hypothetical protein
VRLIGPSGAGVTETIWAPVSVRNCVSPSGDRLGVAGQDLNDAIARWEPAAQGLEADRAAAESEAVGSDAGGAECAFADERPERAGQNRAAVVVQCHGEATGDLVLYREAGAGVAVSRSDRRGGGRDGLVGRGSREF